MVNAWSETSLTTLLSNNDLKDIYNTDEFGLFNQCLPNKTYQLKSEKCYGVKLSKTCITAMAAASSLEGPKMPSFYLVTKVGWMGNCLKSGSESWIVSFLLNVAFVIDNCPAHPHIDNLKAIKLYFLPPNTTSKTQPMDQGVVSSLKANTARMLSGELFKV